MRAAADVPLLDAGAAPGSLAAPARWPLLLGLLLALLPVVALLAAELDLLDGTLGLPLDDAWIHQQFARSLAHADGLAFNAGARVAGSTAPLWTALLSLAFLLHLPPLAFAKALGTLAHLLTVAGVYRLAREHLLRRELALLAAALVATSGVLLWGALSGMEVPLFTALASWGMALHARERSEPASPPIGMALLAVATLVRPEGALLLLLALVDRLLLARRAEGELQLLAPPVATLARAVGVTLLAIVPLLLVNRALGGAFLPTTFDTKAGYTTPGWPRGQYLYEVLGVLAATQPLATLLAPAGVLALLARWGGPRDRGLLPALWALALPLAYGVLSGGGRGIFGNFGRYFYVLVPVVALLAAAALEPLLDLLPPRLRAGAIALHWPLWVGALMLLANVMAAVPAAARYLHNVRDVDLGDVRLARLLAPRLPPAATLAVDDIGALKFLLPNPVIDLAGIVTPEVHRYARESFARTGSYCPGLLAFVRATRPDYVAGFPRRHACFDEGEFRPLLRLDVPDNITLGEGTIVLRAPPWTRYPPRPAAIADGGAVP